MGSEADGVAAPGSTEFSPVRELIFRRMETMFESEAEHGIYKTTDFMDGLEADIYQHFAAPSPDRDGEPGEGDAIQLLALLMELVDRVTAVEHRQDVLGKNQADMRPILDRLDAIERSHRKLRKRVESLAEDIEFGFTQSDEIFTGIKRRYDELFSRIAALEAEREPGAVPTVTEDMVTAYWTGSGCAGEPKPMQIGSIRDGLTAALKAGGAK